MKLTEELEKLAIALGSAGVDYALCGGLAMAVHGHVRTTEDIDLLVRENDLDAIIEVAESLGFWLHTGWMTFNSGRESEQRLYRLVKVEGRDHIMLDLLIVSRLLEHAWNCRRQFEHDGVELTVMSASGLLLMKRETGRTKDQMDVEWLNENGASHQ
ncbi:MAG: nucleotidyltransferase family protein [Planctomycetota bacterium]|nr:nucleotidyltransferase family protein [Planctomycetota bacterium]